MRLIEGASTTEAQWLGAGGIATLPAVSMRQLLGAAARLVVVAPHPDDEILMAGGLLQQYLAAGQTALLVAVTDGEASHPRSSIWPVARLQKLRPGESREALTRLGLDQPDMLRLGFADGGLQTQMVAFEQALAAVIGRGDVVLTTWRLDGHPDHDACGAASASVAAAADASLIEAPVWMWHWSTPSDPRVPWARAKKLHLSAEQIWRKQHAIDAFTSQLAADESTGAAPILAANVLMRVRREFEVYFVN